uniref:Uncharacterized protein n=1 Tax=Leersia perrieri TaxID=77586 RepID=A0A0D9V1I4_9ORYZ
MALFGENCSGYLGDIQLTFSLHFTYENGAAEGTSAVTAGFYRARQGTRALLTADLSRCRHCRAVPICRAVNCAAEALPRGADLPSGHQSLLI